MYGTFGCLLGFLGIVLHRCCCGNQSPEAVAVVYDVHWR